MNLLTSLVFLSLIILHRANFEINILKELDTKNVAGTKSHVTTNKVLTQQQQQQQQQQKLLRSQTVSSSRVTYATLKPKPSGALKIEHVKVSDSITQNLGSNYDQKSTQKKKESSDSDADSNTLSQNTHVHSSPELQKPANEEDFNKREVLNNVDEKSEAKKHLNEESFPKDGVNQDVGDLKQGKTLPEPLVNDPQKKEQILEGQQEPEKFRSELHNEKTASVTREEEKLGSGTDEKLQEQRTIPEELKRDHDSSAVVEESRKQTNEEFGKESSQDESSETVSSDGRLEHTLDHSDLPPDQITLENVQDDSKKVDFNIAPNQPIDAANNAGRIADSETPVRAKTSLDRFPEREGSQEQLTPNDTVTEASLNYLKFEAAKPDEKNFTLPDSDQQPSSVQPPSRLAEELLDNIPSTAFVPGDAKTDNDLKTVDQLEESNAMPSFREWKEKETERSRQLGAEQAIQSNALPGKLKGNKKRINYASVTCGAKIVGANQESQNPSFVLVENKDQYMINPCKARKVFTVELCEPIQVQTIDVGNLELFSSLPQSFDVHVSDRFPSKEWKPLGRFHARDERTVQTFQVDDSLIFAKYIKIEMLSHYGSEHYCPLSILRVFGTTLDEDDDVDESESENLDVLDEETVIDSFTQDNPTNLFASATDTVLSLVKTVLNPSTDNTQKEDSILTSSDGNISSINSSTESRKTMQPCVPEAISGLRDDVSNEGKEEVAYQPQIPDAVIDINDQRSGDREDQSTEGVHSYSDQEQFKIMLIEAARTPLREILSTCVFCDNGSNDTCVFDRHTTCGYYRIMSFFDPQSCLTAWRNIHTTATDPLKSSVSSETSGIIGQINMTTALESEAVENKHQSMVDESGVASRETAAIDLGETPVSGHNERASTTVTDSLKTSSRDSDKGNDVGKSNTLPDGDKEDVGNSGHSQTDHGESSDSSVRSSMAPTSKDYHSADKGVQSCTESHTQGEVDCHSPGRDENTGQAQSVQSQVAQDRPVQGQKAQGQTSQGQGGVQHPNQEKQPISVQNTASGQKVTEQAGSKSLNDKDDSANQSSGTANIKVIYAEASGKSETAVKDYELDGVPVDEIMFQKLSPRGKESAFIKLKNRIKLLEVNLNLTNRYLEELSQRYKRQMEEMHSSLNKTITKLSNMAKTAEERDVKQQDHIANLETAVKNLTSVVTSIENSMDSMQQQMVERHLCLMFLEILVFSGILIFCLNRRSVQSEKTDSASETFQTELLQKSGIPRSNGFASRYRRKSSDLQPSRDNYLGSFNLENSDYASCKAVEEVKSHPPLAGTKTAANVAVSGVNDFVKKKKKKKLSHIRSLSPSAVKPKTSLLSLTSHSPATGLIFGTCKDSISCESLEKLGGNKLRSNYKRISWDSSAYKPWKWNIFGSNQDQKSSNLSCNFHGISAKPKRSEIQDGNLFNGLFDQTKDGVMKTFSLADNKPQQKSNELCLLNTNDVQMQSKSLMKKVVASRGRPVAD